MSPEVKSCIAAMDFSDIKVSSDVGHKNELPLHLGSTEHTQFLNRLREAILL